MMHYLLANRKILIQFDVEDKSNPHCIADGMTIDSEGFLYLAMFNDSKVIKINPKYDTHRHYEANYHSIKIFF